MYKHIIVFLLVSVISIFSAFANEYNAHYTVIEWEKMAVVVAVAITVFSPSKYRIIIIGTFLGCMCSYFTYKYILPMFINY
jgi:hypothetical protein